MKLTTFTFYKNTPFTDFQNTILFKDNEERDEYFDKYFVRLDYPDMNFNFMRDRGEVSIPQPYEQIQGVNYCRFKSDFEEDITYYAFVVDYEYINDNTTKLSLVIDGIMTFCQGDKLSQLTNLSVTRKHLSRFEYNRRIKELKNNDDVIDTYTKSYTHKNELLFNKLSVLIESSAKLEADFGDVDDPKIETSEGGTFDRVSSPLNLYLVDKVKFNELMDKLSKYSWITQNMRNVSLIPSVFLEGKTEKVEPKDDSLKDFDGLYKLRDEDSTVNNVFDEDLKKISKSMEELYEMFRLDPEEDQHLLRNEYTTTEVYTFNGDKLFIDNGRLSLDKGLNFKSVYMMGYNNEIGIYVDGYKADGTNEGSFLNDAIYLKDFDDVPIMVDNYNLALSKNASQRKLAESKLASNRIDTITDSDSDPEQRFYDAAGLATNLSPLNFFGKFVDEHEFYRKQKAQDKDMAMETDTVTEQSHQNSLAIANNFFGIHVKHTQPNNPEWKKIKKYYKLFGYEVNDENSTVDPRHMTICDYVQFKGQYVIDGMDISILEMTKARFENGVRFWHYNGKSAPMQQNVMDNEMRD